MSEADTLIERVSSNATGHLKFLARLIPIEESVRQETCVLLELQGVKCSEASSSLIPVC